MIDRRLLLQLTTGMAAGAVAGSGASTAAAASQAPLDRPTPPKSALDARLTWARLVGDLSGRPIFYFTHGSVWGFKPQADDLTVEDFARRLYGYSSLSVRKMERQPDGGYAIRQKTWSFYRDPVSDEITDKIPNPYTGVTDTAAPMTGPVSSRILDMGPQPGGAMPYNMRIRRLAKTAVVETTSFARFQSGGISWYKLEGNLDNYVCQIADLDNPAATHVPNHYSQNLVAEWQTWTKMHGMPGHILFKGDGEPLHALDQVPGDQIAAIERFFPGALGDVRGW